MVTMTWKGNSQHQVLRVENLVGNGTPMAPEDNEDPFDP
jgi:hypothetical protein